MNGGIKMTEDGKIHFKDLSFWLKVVIIFAYFQGCILFLAFLIGFIQGMLMV